MKAAVVQLPVATCYDGSAIAVLRHRIRECEDAGVALLCCPEGVLGGLADYVDDPSTIAIPRYDTSLAKRLAPLASDSVTTIIGFTERADDGRYYNAAAVFSNGEVTGIYRKRHPAIRQSRYSAGAELPVFSVNDRALGILICRDSVDATLMASLASQGARIVCIPTNNGMPAGRGGAKLVDEVRSLDRSYAERFDLAILRADVVGTYNELTSHGATMVTTSSGEQFATRGEAAGELLIVPLPS